MPEPLFAFAFAFFTFFTVAFTFTFFVFGFFGFLGFFGTTTLSNFDFVGGKHSGDCLTEGEYA